jgi:transposase-like protein
VTFFGDYTVDKASTFAYYGRYRRKTAVNLTDQRFQNQDKARKYLEAQRWPHGPVCPHCGNADQTKIGALKGKSHRPGVYQCNECREQFTVTVGSVMERSKIPLNKWLLAMHLMGASKKGVSAHQLHRMLEITYQSAWFLAHRIREAMRQNELAPMGGGGSIVEVDETFIGRKQGAEVKQGAHHKHAVLTLVERSGSARSFHVESTRKADVLPIVLSNLDRESHVMTDEAATYAKLGDKFAKHDSVDHSRGEYGYTDRKTNIAINTNTVEGYYSIFKRGMIGVYQHCGEKHLHRYLAEFDFRYSNRSALGVDDTERVAMIAKGTEGKRLVYRAADKTSNAL